MVALHMTDILISDPALGTRLHCPFLLPLHLLHQPSTIPQLPRHWKPTFRPTQTTHIFKMGFDEMLKEGEQALDGQTSADQQAASGQSGGHESMEDTMVDSGKNSVRNQL